MHRSQVQGKSNKSLMKTFHIKYNNLNIHQGILHRACHNFFFIINSLF